jgi:hypothetical protein
MTRGDKDKPQKEQQQAAGERVAKRNAKARERKAKEAATRRVFGLTGKGAPRSDRGTGRRPRGG